jgi:hypothetical protein
MTQFINSTVILTAIICSAYCLLANLSVSELFKGITPLKKAIPLFIIIVSAVNFITAIDDLLGNDIAIIANPSFQTGLLLLIVALLLHITFILQDIAAQNTRTIKN